MKVAVYTIALNEAAHAERWANSCAEADYRIVADTGSTDDTVERLTAAGVTVHRIAVRPWRFDVARNTAMALIPADVDVCCSMDMDRFLEPGWREKLEEAWKPDTTALFNRVIYRSSVDDPNILRGWPAKNFHHRWGYRFKRPVHEALVHDGPELIASCDDIVMCEVQDLTKGTRNQYLPLMEVAHREDPNDAQICFWLGREYMWAGRPEEAATMFERYLASPNSTWGEERSEAMRYLARVQPDKVLVWLDRARMEAPHRREIWLDLAEHHHAKEDWPNLFWACLNGIEKTSRTGSYLDESNCWGVRLYEMATTAAWRVRALEQAIVWGTRASELEPTNERLRRRLSFLTAQRRPTPTELGERCDPQQPSNAAWRSLLDEALSLRDFGDMAGFARSAHSAFLADPTRPEPLRELSDFFLSTGRGDRAALYAEAALGCLADDSSVSGWAEGARLGLLHSLSVAASWSVDPERKERGRIVCDRLALSREIPVNVRETARWNAGWYAGPLNSIAPSVGYKQLTIAAPQGYHAANLGICNYNDEFILTVRAVNYTMMDGYHVKGDDPSYRSRVLYCILDSNFEVAGSLELALPADLPVLSTEALGFDDPRPFVWHDQLWCALSSRQLSAESHAQMLLARIVDDGPSDAHFADWGTIPSGMPVRWEKNWMPQVVGDELRLVYSVDPTRVLGPDGREIAKLDIPISAETWLGGSQLIAFDDGWLAMVHESEWVNSTRRYFHRFIWFDGDLTLRRFSRRFYLSEPGYEFVAGLAWHPDREHLIFSFSRNDRDSYLAFISAAEVREITLSFSEHEHIFTGAVRASADTLRTVRHLIENDS